MQHNPCSAYYTPVLYIGLFFWLTLFPNKVGSTPFETANIKTSTVLLPPANLTQTYTIPGSYTFTIPEGVTSITVQTWGGGGRGGSRTTSTDGTGGGGGGAFSQHTFSVIPGDSYVVVVGSGSSSNTAPGGDSWVSLTNVSGASVLAKGGNSVANNSNTGATGGSAASGIGSIKYSGGNGANRVSSTSSGGGGSSAGTGANGNNASGTTAGSAPSGGGSGGAGRTSVGSGNAGQYPGGGGGGAVRGSTGSPSGGTGGHGRVIISYSYNVDAGPDQSQCNNSLFFVNTATPPTGYTSSWSVVSGTGFIYDNSRLKTSIIVPAGSSATVRLTMTNGTVTATDDLVLTNTTSCTPTCTNPLNENGNLELSGTITSYNLSFQGTPAAIIYQNTNPIGWSEAYGSATPNTTSFTGAYHLNKTGSNGNPRSGSKFVYMAGNGFCLSALKTGATLHCGRTYRVSVWIAAFTNGSTQGNSPFFLEFFGGGNNMPGISIAHQAIAPASTSWNNLNWQRYSFDFTVPAEGYQWGDFVFTTLSNTNGIVIDDMCIEEVFSGAKAIAGPDIFGCTNTMSLSGNTPASGFSGSWSVLSGTASIANPTSPTSNVTITSGNAARLRWTVSSTSGASTIMALDPKREGGFENCCSASDNGWTTVNHTTNQWHVGTASGPTSGNRAAYISNNSGTSHAYTLTTAQTSHLYRDIVIAPGASNIQLTFKWKGQGQSGTDRLLVYTAPTSITPSAGNPSSTSTTLSGATLVSATNLHLSANYQTVNITLPNSLAGTTFRLIFTWQNNSSSGVNPPVSLDEVGIYYDLAACSSMDEVNIGFAPASSLTVNNASVCPGESAVLTASGCSGGSLLWSTGSTQPSITVNPTSTTSYSVTCTPAASTNILQNPGLESATNMQNWDNWGNASVTTNAADVFQGSKALMVNTIGQSWGAAAQGFSVTAGRRYKVRVYAKTTNTNVLPVIRYEFYNGGTFLENQNGALVTSNNYQLYEFEAVSPPNANWMTVIAETGQGGQLFLDNWEVVSTSTCNAVQTATVTVLPSQNITLSNINVGNCINHPLQDVAQVTVQVAWNTAPSNDYLGVTIQNKTEYINVGGGATSPQTLTFWVPANGQTNIPITARWYFNPNFGCPNTATFNAPNACSNDELACNILYLCGLDKPADGDAFDHGLIEYIMANNSGNLLPALVKDNGTANDFYDPNDQNTPITVNLNDYDMIIISPTTQGYVSTRLRDMLLPFKGSILNMNYVLQQGLETTNGAGYFAWGNTAFTSASQSVSIYNYDNINPSYALVKTGGTTKTGATSSLWFNAGDANGLTNAMAYSYKAHSIPGVSTTHGFRQYLGLHMNGLYANSQNGGSLPAPASSYFHPARHLTPEMKIILDQTLKNTAICQPEICANLTDDDEDSLIDCNDPDCWKIINREYDEGNTGWDLYNQNGAASTRNVDNTSQLSGKNAMRINISTATGTNWHIQFLQQNVLLETGKTYQITFSARSTANRTIGVFTDLGASPWNTYFSQNVNLTSAAQTFTFTYTQNVTTSIGRVGFNLGQSNQTVWIDNVIFTEVCQVPEICDNGIDDNGNGLADCSDPDCPCCNTLTAGGIVTGNQIECQNYNPGIISSTSPASGSAGTILYQWEYSNDEINWVEISGATGLTYDPGMIYQTTYYRRKARLNTCNLWGVYSNTVIKQNLGFDNFQILTRNNTTFNGGTHVHGPMAVGGNLVINSNGAKVEVNMDNTGTYIFPGDGSTTTGLLVKGGVTFQSGYLGILSNRYVHIGNSANLASGDNNTNSATQVYPAGTGYNHSQRIETTIDQTPNPAVFQNVAYDFEALFDLYHNSSIDLGARTNNVQLFNTSNVAITNNNVTSARAVRINSLNTGYNYLNLTTTSLNNITEMNFNGSGVPSSTKILVINVLVNSNFTWNNSNMPGLSAPSTAPYMIWNFYGPTTNTVTINNSSLIFGTIFAPNQNVLKVGQNDIEGSVIAKSFTVGNGQLHDFMFANFCDILDCTESLDVVIEGPSSVCSGANATLTATGGQTYLWNNGLATPSISVSTPGTYVVTVTSAAGCTGTASKTLTVVSVPNAPLIGTVTQPSCTISTGSVVLTGLPGSGSWTIQRIPGDTTYTGTSTSLTINNLPGGSSYTFTVTNSANCTSVSSGGIAINPAIQPPLVEGDESVCVGSTANVTPSTGGTWTSSNNTLAIVTNGGLVTGLLSGNVILTYTRTSDGCQSSINFPVQNCSCPNTVLNHEFNSGTTSWSYYHSNGANGSFSINTGSQLSGLNSARVNVSTSTGNHWHVSLGQENLAVQAGKLYQLTFMAKASSSKTITVSAQDLNNGWSLVSSKEFTLTTANQTFTMTFISAVTTNNIRLAFQLGSNASTTYIDNVVFNEICPSPVLNWSYDCDDNRQIEIIGRGRECQTTNSLTISNPANVNQVYAEVVYKTNNPGPTITFTDGSGNSYTAYRIDMNPSWQQVWVYRVLLPATSVVHYNDNTFHCNLQSFVIYVERNSSGNTQSNGYFTNITGYNDIKSFVINIPSAETNRNITIKLPISEMTNDGRYLKATATAGSVTNTTFVYGSDQTLGNCCLNIVEVDLDNVPGNITSITIQIDTRNNQNGQSVNGQSYVLAASINAEATCNCPSPPPPPTTTNAQRCGEGSVVLQASGCSGGVINWYENETGGLILGTGNNFTTPSLTASQSYYAACFVDDCESSRTETFATINDVNAAITGVLNVCPADLTTTLTATGGSSYLWSTGATTQNINVSPSSATTYSVTVTSNGCSSNTSVTVLVLPTCCEGPVTANVIAKYNFSEGSGSIVNDVSGYGTPMPLTIQNPGNTTWVAGCGLNVVSNTRISSTGNAAKIKTAIQASNAITIEAWVQAANTTQTGPARIVSMSANTGERNFTLGQVGSTWSQRIRHTGADSNGNPERFSTSNTATTNLTHLVFTRNASGVERLYINGVQNATWTLSGNFSNWSDFALHLANEQTNDRSWLGTLYNVTLYDQALSNAQVTQNFNAGSKSDCSHCPPPNCVSLPPAPGVGTITQPTCNVSTGSVILTGLPSTGTWTITRMPGNNTYSGTGPTYVVTGLPVYTTYTFTVTNNGLCTSLPSVNVDISPIPSNPVLGGATSVCVGVTTNVTPGTSGTWASSNTGIATISNAGVVTGIATGSVTLTYTRTSDGCSATIPFNVHANPSSPVIGFITQPTCILTTGSVFLNGLPSSGSWTITRTPGGITYTGSGTSYTVTGLPANTTYTFTVTNVNSCTSPSSSSVVVNPIPGNPVTGGASSVCVGLTTNVTPSTSGTWTSSNTSIATITNAGTVTAIAAGSVTLTYTRTADGCNNTRPFTVFANPTPPVVGAITQPTCTTPTGSVVLSGLPSSGSWTITRIPGGTTYTGTGTSFTVTGLPANTSYTFTVTNSNTCVSAASNTVVVNAIPLNPVLGGASGVCIGSTTNVTPATAGTWTSSNTAIATITNAGVVTGVTSGTVTLTYIRTSDGCSNTSNFVVNSLPVATITGDNYICTGLSTTLTAAGGTSYVWQTGQNTSVITVSPSTPTTYIVTVTNVNGCTNTASYLVQLYPGFTVNATSPTQNICVGQDLVLNGSMTNGVLRETYTGISGTSVNNLISHSSYPSGPNVREIRPNTIGPNGVGENYGTRVRYYFTSQVSGDHQFVIYGDDETILYWSGSDATSPLTVLANIPGWTNEGELTRYASQTSQLVNLTAGQQYYFELLHKEGGGGDHYGILYRLAGDPGFINIPESTVSPVKMSWTGPDSYTSSNVNNVISNNTTSNAGNYTLTGTDLFGCQVTSDVNITVNANPTEPVVGTITQPTCTTPTGSVILNGLPASGSWTITRTPGGTTYTGTGTSYTVTGLPVNSTYTFTVTNSNTCTSPASANVTINAIPSNPTLGGASAVCVGSTANVTPATAGTWSSSNTSVATITNVGLVTGIAAGSVTLTYTRTSDGCSNTVPMTIHNNPTAPIIGTITQPTCATPSGSVILSGLPSSGSWTITRSPGSNTYSGTGISFTVTGLPANTSYTFTVVNANNCASPASVSVAINAIPGAPVLGGTLAICQGGTTNVTPSVNGTWTSSNASVASVTNGGVVSGIAGGAVTLTYTRTSDGCSNTLPFTVYANPPAPVVGTITQPTCITPTGSVVLSGLPASGSWTITRTPGGTTYSGTGTSYTVTGLPVNTTYTFTVTNSNSCASPSSTNVAINAIPTNPVTGGASSVCVGSTANVTPASAGTWTSSNTAIATITNGGVATGVSAGSVTLTYTRTSDGCSNTRPFTVNANPTAPVVGVVTQPTCTTPTGSVVLSGLPSTGSWTITRTPGGTTYSGSGTSNTITGLPVNTTYTFTVTNSNSCASPSSTNVVINQIPANPVTGGASSVCVGSTSNVTPATAGTWTSSNTAFATITNGGVVSGVSAGSVTLTYTRTSDGCSNTRPFTVHANPTAPVVGTVTQPTCTTPTGSVVLNSLPSTGSWTITRTPGGTTYTGSGTSYTVTGLPVNTTYTFTVTNSNSCTSPSSTNVAINPIPTNPVTGGATSVCVGATTNVTPGVSGTWSSSNTGIATITNGGVVTGVTVGSVTLTFTRTSDGCTSSLPFTVHANPTAPVLVTITQPTCIIPTGSVVLSGLPSTGSWTINTTPGGTTYSDSGTSYTVTGLPVNTTYTFTVTNLNECTSPSSTDVFIDLIPTNPVTGGENSVCAGLSANVTPITSGNWVSSNTAIATITNGGLVTGVSVGSVTLTYTRTSDGCSSTLPFTVFASPTAPLVGTVIQPNCTTTTGSVNLTGLPATGSWTLTRTPGGTTYTGSGNSFTITGLPVNTTYTFAVTNDDLCVSSSSSNVVIHPIPTNPVIGGAPSVCAGVTTNVTPNSSGTWISSNTSVATVSNAGLVTGLAAGNVTLTYTRTADNCTNSVPFTVLANPTTPVIGLITQPTCTLPTGTVTLNGLPNSGTWILTRSPGGTNYSGTGTSTTITGLPANATYSFIVSNNQNCVSPVSTAIIINPVPSIPILGGATTVCTGSTANVTPSMNGFWTSSNNSIATVTNEGLVTGISAGTVILTYTRTEDGCSNTMLFNVNSNPNAPVVGTITQPTCYVPTASVLLTGLPSVGGWVLTRTPGGVTYSGSGSTFTVNPLSPDITYTFTVTISNGCASSPSTDVVVNAIPGSPNVGGPTEICVGTTVNVTPSTSGTWTSSVLSVASVSNAGEVTALSAGITTLTYTRTSDGCSNSLPLTINVNPTPPIVGITTQPTCITPTGSVDFSGLPSTGAWTMTRTPGNVTYNSTGTNYTVSGLAPNTTYSFVVRNQNNCTSISSNNVVIDPVPSNPVPGGATSVCIGSTANVTPSSNGTWTSSNPSMASITNSGVVTGIAAGSVTLTYVRTSDGCSVNTPFSVFTNPTIPVAGTVTQPTCINPTGSVVLQGLPSAGSWTVIRNPGGVTYSGSGTTYTVTGLPPNGSYSFAVTNNNLCTSLYSNNIVIQPIPSNPVLGGPDLVCVGNTATMTPSTNGTWNSSNPSVATITNTGSVNGVSSGNVVFTYTRTIDGCSNNKPFIVYDNPTAPVIGSIIQPNCLTMTGSVMLNNLPLTGSWTITRTPGGITYTGSGSSYQVTGLPPSGNYTFTVTTNTNCISPASNQVVINGIPSNPGVSINYDGSVCLTDNKQLSAVPIGGVGPYTYQWTGPLGFSSINDTILVTQNGNYSVTVTDANLCKATTNGFVYARYEPFIVTINATICEGDEIDLDVSSTSAVSFLWSANAGGATTRDVTVTPAYPSATYFVTVTNDLGCTAVPEINILVNPKPEVAVSGPDEICVGQNSQLTPTTGGVWVSTNPSVAHISPSGQVTGLSPGTSSFIFTENVFGCSSDASVPILVNPRPVVSFTGLNPICIGDTTTLTPSSEGTWSSSNPVVATITDSGVVTGLSVGFVTFIYTNNSTNCSSNASVPLQVQSLPVVTISGPETACIGTNASFSVNHIGGTWSTSNPLTATINNSGTLTTIDTGLVTVYYTFVSGVCQGIVSKEFRIFELPSVQFAGPAEICVGQTTSLTPSEGGVWTSSNPLIASITPQGLVSALTSGYTAFTFVHDSTGCISETSGTLTVFAKPSINLNGPAGICVGGTSQFLPFTGGVWQTNNPFVANITNGGVVTGVGPGTATFSFIHNETGCVSDTSVIIQVGSAPTATIDFQGSVCVENNKTISVQPTGGAAPYSYSWIGPLGFTGNTQMINVVNNGTYFVTITDNFGCRANVSGFVHQRFDPVVVNLQTQVCDGQTTNLSVNASSATAFQWSSNAGSAVTPSVTVRPTLPSSTYFVTVTNNLGCVAVAQANILVNPKPIVSISGPNILCVGQTSNLLPNSGGTWVSLNPTRASITNTGVVTAFQPGTARFLFTQVSTGCVSDTTGVITINPNTTTSLSGVSELCIGQQTNLLPNSGGTWTALHPTLATVTTNGTVTALAQGNAQFRFTNTFGCVTPVNLSIRVNSIPSIVLDGPQQVCVGSVTTMLPSSGGTWISSNPLIASISNGGTVTGVSPGSARFLFTNNLTGCRSDSSAIITVVAGSPVSVTGPTSVCAGATTTLSPSFGGSWVSQNPSVATVNSSGVVTGINAGTATFIFTSAITGCPSSPTLPITVNPRPTVSITGNNNICIGQTTTMQPTSGGTWASSNLAVANITSSGVVTGLASGLVNFTFTSAATGCVSLPSGNINVQPRPVTSVTNTNICIGATTNLQPSTGGSWISLQPSVASVNTGGIVTGISTGTAQFRFTDAATGCVSDPTPVHTVSPKPVVSVTGSAEFCQGITTQLSPVSGGSWSSLNPSVATVTNAGVVTGISAGTARFVFTSNQGCSSDPTQQIVINPKPLAVFVGGTEICVGSTTQLSPNTGGTWISARNNIASITDSGLVTGLASGNTNFVFVSATTGCTSDSTINVFVNPAPTPGRLGSGTVCIGQTVQLTPTAGGTWTSLSPGVAIVSSSGLVTGIGSGVASFRFTVSNTACEVVYNSGATVLDRPVVTLLGNSSICVGGTTQLSPNSGGTWSATPLSIASIDQAGIVTGMAQGVVTFTFTQTSTGCVSSASTPVTVLARPSVAINGPSVICINATTQLIPGSGGSWVSGNPAIATVSSGGLVIGISQGNTSFLFTDSETGCTSAATTNVTVQPAANISVSGISEVCLGYNTTLSASSAGTWFSTRSDIAKTSANGLVTGMAPGKVSFYFVDAATSCATYLPDNAITVRNCIDPDINVTMINTTLSGNVKTNDEVPEGTTYPGTVFLVSRPTGSASSIQVNGNGSYTFSANMAGLYTYDVMVCLPGAGVNCPVSRLAIQVVNPNSESHNVVTNLDLMYITENSPVFLHAKENDKCISGLACDIATDRMSVMTQAKKGTGLFMTDGRVMYTPQSNFVGMDTIRYQVCASDNMTNCRTAQQIITVMAANADRAIAAGDDFFFVNKGNSLPTSNVLNNDRETSGGTLSVMAEGTMANPVLIQAGSYYIDASGNLSFTPNSTFAGTVDIVYTVCNNVNECVKATAHVLVLDNMRLRIRAYLEGALMENSGIKGTDNRPLMRDNLRLSPYTGQNHIPAIDPYTHPMEFFDLSYIYEHTTGSDAQRFTEISDPATVFAVTGQNAIVDWVFIEVRSPKDYTELLSTRSALIQRDGDIVDLDGISPVEIPGVRLDSVYVVVKHRNHLGVMSLKQATSGLIDFTLPSTPTFSFGTSRNDGYNHVNLGQKPDVMDGVMALWGGDFDSNGKVKFVNPEDDQNIMFFDVLTFPTNFEFIANYNFTYGYHQGDYNLNGKTKYDNPDDDKNMLFYQVLFHPLNTNYISNFNFIIEQVPSKK